MYVVISGAKKNVGDFLITQRCEELLRAFRPEHDLYRIPYWEPLDRHADAIRQCAAAIILGGPGYQRNTIPKVYPYLPQLLAFQMPVVPMALGWMAFPGDRRTLRQTRLSRATVDVIREIHSRIRESSCRCYFTEGLLRAHGVSNTTMTGCAAWYDLASLGKPLTAPETIERVVLTTPEEPFNYQPALDVARMLRRMFPSAQLLAGFHRGVEADEFTGPAEARRLRDLAAALRVLGVHVLDLAYSPDRLAMYDQADLHVGYRVHAHLYFLSKRKPSILIHEDGRGIGTSDALGVRGFDAVHRTWLGVIVDAFPNMLTEFVLHRRTKMVVSRLRFVKPTVDLMSALEAFLIEELSNGFARIGAAALVIDRFFPRMKRFLASLP